MSPTWILLLILIGLLVIGTSIFLVVVLRRARKISFAADTSASGEPDKAKPAPGEFLSYASNLELHTSFRHALKLLRTYVTGRDYRYRVPWFLMTGQSESGKTALLEGHGPNLSTDDPGHDSGQLNWYFFNEGIVIDVAGDFVLRGDGTANHHGWNTISRLLLKHRPRRPLDGVVLTIPCEDLLDAASLTNERRFKLEQKATCLHNKLWQSQRILGMRLPIYILVTKCDEVPGFTSLCAQLPDKLQAQMFGWSNDRTLEIAYNPELIPEAFRSLHQYLSTLQFEIYTEREQVADADDIFLLPAALDSMRSALQIYLDVIFKQSAYHEPFFFRGFYFCGEAADESRLPATAPIPVSPDWKEKLEGVAAPPPQTRAPERKPVFLIDLFKEKVFAEDFLARPVKRAAISRNRTVVVSQVLSLLIIVGGGLGLTFSYYRMAQQRDNLSQFLNDEKNLLSTPAMTRSSNVSTRSDAGRRLTDESDLAQARPDPYRPDRASISYQLKIEEPVAAATPGNLAGPSPHHGVSELLRAMNRMSGRRYYSFFIPSSWFSPISERLQNVVTEAFTHVVFETLRADLEKRSQSLLTGGSASLRPCPNNAPNPRLPDYLEQLNELRVNLDRYDKLIEKGSGSLANLNELVIYLCHDPLPGGFDEENELYKRALAEANGTQIDTPAIFREMVDSVAGRIEELYEGSFDRKTVNYDKLEEITEAEGVLRRPEYTWLATSVVADQRSEFQQMTIWSALIDLRGALEDLRGQRFMTSGSEDEVRRYDHLVRKVLVWDQETLRQVIAVYEQYQTFVDTKSYSPWQKLDDSAKGAALIQVRERISRVLRRAQRYEALPPASDGSALRTSLVEEIRLLQEAEPLLSKVLQITANLGMDRQLRNALYDQGSRLVRNIQREFLAQRFYFSRQDAGSANRRPSPDFSWWDGRQPVSFLVYDLNGKDELTGYLTIQRRSIAFLGRDLFIPVITFFSAQKITLQTGGPIDWEQILSDLDAYDNKTPGNPIAALENFVRADMDRVSLDSCYGQARVADEASADYFLSIRNSLRTRFYERCQVLARIKAINEMTEDLKNYEAIENSFNARLSGAFPFAEAGRPPLDPWAMLKVFKELKDKEKAAREALDRSVDFGARPQAAKDFLDQMDRARDFFAAFIEKNQGPALDFRIQFRVNREHEIDAKQIIDWKLEVGKKKFSYNSEDLTGHWVYGEPVRLTLRWANDSPRQPLSSSAPAPYSVKDRSAIFEYNDRWALFRLLLTQGFELKRAGTLEECNPVLDPDPYTLKFVIRTEPDPTALPQFQIEKAPAAEVFLRVTLLTANKAEPLMLPCLPVKAPPVPSLFGTGANTSTDKDK